MLESRIAPSHKDRNGDLTSECLDWDPSGDKAEGCKLGLGNKEGRGIRVLGFVQGSDGAPLDGSLVEVEVVGIHNVGKIVCGEVGP